MAVFAALMALPVDSCALVSIKSEVSYQSNETDTGDTNTKSVQERFAAILNTDSVFSSKLRMAGIFRFDVLVRENETTATTSGSVSTNNSESTEIQPNIDVRFFTDAVQLSTGYRKISRDENIVTGTTGVTPTSTIQNNLNDTTEAVADATIKAGSLPNIRLKYSSRDERLEQDGTVQTDTATEEYRGSIDYKLGIFSLNADYGKKTETNKVGMTERDQVDKSGQLFINKKFSNRVTASIRENFLISDITETDPSKNVKKSTTTSEFRLILTPVMRSSLNSSYILRKLKNNDQYVDENIWLTTASYTLPRFFRFYGSFTTRDTDTEKDTSLTQNSVDSTVLGVNFKHRVGNVNFTSRYERRTDDTTTDALKPNSTKNTVLQNVRTNIDWLIDVKLTRYLSVSLSEAYVSTDTDSTIDTFSNVSSVVSTKQGSSENNKYRLKATFGPIKNLTASPYIDYTVISSSTQENKSGIATSTESGSTTTELVVPVSYKLKIGDNIDFAFTDNYRSRTVENDNGDTSNSSTNNAVFRLSIPRLTKSTSFTGDATFTSSSTDTTSTSSSSYTARLGWNNNPHRLDANIGYQTGENMPSTTKMGIQYALNLALKKVTLNFQATYDYSVTEGGNQPMSTAQTLFMLFSLRN